MHFYVTFLQRSLLRMGTIEDYHCSVRIRLHYGRSNSRNMAHELLTRFKQWVKVNLIREKDHRTSPFLNSVGYIVLSGFTFTTKYKYQFRFCGGHHCFLCSQCSQNYFSACSLGIFIQTDGTTDIFTLVYRKNAQK